jgi:pilus assembly protein CpaF
MFGLRSKKPDAAEAAPPAGPLDRLGRRTSAETRAGSPGASVSKEARLASAAAALHDAVAPRLREMVRAGAPAGEITRQAGQLAQLHFRSNGVLLAPLENPGTVPHFASTPAALAPAMAPWSTASCQCSTARARRAALLWASATSPAA